MVGPYCTAYVVALPFGSTVPLTTAEVLVTSDGDVVVAVGGALLVVNVASEPAAVPAGLVATIR